MIYPLRTTLLLAQAATTETSLTLTAIVAAAIIAFITAYFTDLGKRAFRKQHLEAILEETKRTQELIARLELDLNQRQLIGETELQYRERQLAEFYGPIYGSIKSTGQLWRLWVDGKLKDLSHDVQELFRHQNDFIVDLLRTKSHLVEGHVIPECIAAFITSATIFNIGTRVGGGLTQQEVADLPEASFPKEFFTYFVVTTEILKENLDRLYKAHQIVVPEKIIKEVSDRRLERQQPR